MIKAPTHADRMRAGNDAISRSLLDELETTLGKYNHQAGVVGNKRGDLDAATRALREATVELQRLEQKALRIRNAFDVYMGKAEDDATPAG